MQNNWITYVEQLIVNANVELLMSMPKWWYANQTKPDWGCKRDQAEYKTDQKLKQTKRIKTIYTKSDQETKPKIGTKFKWQSLWSSLGISN